MFVKGASEIILDCCDSFQAFDGPNVPITPEFRATIEEAIASMANLALRTIIIAKKKVDGSSFFIILGFTDKDDKGVFNIEKTGLTMIGLIGIKDILREEVPGAIKACKKAGVRVRMVTGDNLLTARAIAIECGIIDPRKRDSLVMNGADFIE